MPSRVTVGELVLDPFQVVFKNFRTFLVTVGPFLALAAVIGLTGNLLTGSQGVDEDAISEDPGTFFRDLAVAAAAGSLLSVVQFLAQVLAIGLALVAARAALDGDALSFGDAWSTFRPRAGTVLLTVLVLTVFIIGTALAGGLLFFLILPLLAIPFVWLWILSVWGLAPPVALFENATVSESLRRSQDLSRGSRGTLFGAFLVLALAYVLVNVILVAPVMLSAIDWESMLDPSMAPPVVTGPSPGLMLGVSALSFVVNLVFWPAIAVALVSAYRKLDAARPAEAPAPWPTPGNA